MANQNTQLCPVVGSVFNNHWSLQVYEAQYVQNKFRITDMTDRYVIVDGSSQIIIKGVMWQVRFDYILW